LLLLRGGGDKEGVKKKRSPPQQRKKKKSLVGNFLSDMVESIIKSELEKHMSRTSH
jgi:hypothetical protein